MSPHTPSRTRFAPIRAALAAALAVALAGAVGCSGDDREFVEAVEVSESGLTGLAILPPEPDVDLALAPGESIELGLAGTGENGLEVEVSSEGRDWRVADPSVGTIDGNGRFTALADGTTAVRLGIGGVRAPSVPVTVSSAPISAVSEVRGPDAPDPCLVARYVAIGTFDDGTRRLLADTAWSLPGAESEGVAAPLLRDAEDGTDGAVGLVPRAPGPLVLRAAARGQGLDETLQVPDTLTAIEIGTPPALLRVGDRVDLVATGTYADADGTTRTETLTDTVDFALEGADEDFGTVSNLDGSRGRFEAGAQGSATVVASCGAVRSVPVTLTVGSGGTGTGGDDGLSFDRGSLTLSLTTDLAGVRVRVSTGDEFDEDRIADDATVTSDDTNVVRVVDPVDGTDGVDLFPVREGSTRVVARDEATGAFETLDVTVVP